MKTITPHITQIPCPSNGLLNTILSPTIINGIIVYMSSVSTGESQTTPLLAFLASLLWRKRYQFWFRVGNNSLAFEITVLQDSRSKMYTRKLHGYFRTEAPLFLPALVSVDPELGVYFLNWRAMLLNCEGFRYQYDVLCIFRENVVKLITFYHPRGNIRKKQRRVSP